MGIKINKDGIFKDENNRVTIVTGHFGSGKTEFAVNLALLLAATQDKIALVDIDVVNPYFRSRERRELLTSKGIRLICSSSACSDADVPTLPAEILTVFQDESINSVIDVGGDDSGARVLGQFKPHLSRIAFDMLFVLNANRPMTNTPESAVNYLRRIEAAGRVPVTAIVNNTHLCGDTTPEEILKGAALAKEVSALTGIPICCHVVERALIPLLPELCEDVFPIDVLMKKPWEE